MQYTFKIYMSLNVFYEWLIISIISYSKGRLKVFYPKKFSEKLVYKIFFFIPKGILVV